MRANREDMKLLVNRLESRNQKIQEKQEEKERDKKVKQIFSELNIREVEE